MKSKEEILLESKVSDILIDLLEEATDLFKGMSTSDLQGHLQVKAMKIIKIVREAKK